MILRWVVAVGLTVALAGCGSTSTPKALTPSSSFPSPVASPSAKQGPSPPAEPSPAVAPPAEPSLAVAPPASHGTALAALGTLAVKGRAPKTGYNRDLFGQAWADVDRNGCDTRNDILARDLTRETFRPGTRDCVVITGVLADPYTGRTVTFAKADASAVQIDHVVALSDAWQKGAQQWNAPKRLAFANDPLNLLAVDGPTNSSKSDGDAATWLPPNKIYRCPMVARQTAVKVTYGLWVTPAEHDAIARLLSACPDEPLPTGGQPTPLIAAVPTAPPTAGEPAPAPAPPARVDPNFGSCKVAKANGAGPYTRGTDPEYDYYRDGDNDGSVCE